MEQGIGGKITLSLPASQGQRRPEQQQQGKARSPAICWCNGRALGSGQRRERLGPFVGPWPKSRHQWWQPLATAVLQVAAAPQAGEGQRHRRATGQAGQNQGGAELSGRQQTSEPGLAGRLFSCSRQRAFAARIGAQSGLGRWRRGPAATAAASPQAGGSRRPEPDPGPPMPDSPPVSPAVRSTRPGPPG